MLTERDRDFISVAFNVAKHVKAVRGARMAALVVYKNKIVGAGHNQMKSHPFHFRFAKNEEAIFFHAETSAIKDALNEVGIIQLRKVTLYIARARFPKNWEYGLARPCEGCIRCINTFEIPRVVYTGNSNQLYVEE